MIVRASRLRGVIMRSRPEDAAAPRTTRVLVLWLLSAATIAIAAATSPAASSPAWAATSTSEVTVVRAGYGDIRVEGAGGKLVLTCTSELDEKDEKVGCTFSVPTGTALTFRAIPRPVEDAGGSPVSPVVQSDFRGWSRPACKATGAPPTGTIKATGDVEGVVAQFSPVWLDALVNGGGTVVAGGSRQTCAEFGCQLVMGLFKPDEPVTVTGVPTTAGATIRWGFGCDPYGSPGTGRCVVHISDARNFVGVSFDGSDPAPRPPFNKVVHLKVERVGAGSGQVEGSGASACLDDPPWSMSCGGACDFDRLQYQTQVRLLAVASAGSVFDSWAGPPCLTDDTCTFTVGRYPKVVAIFKTRGGATALLAASVRGTGNTRAVVVRLRTNGAAHANLRLLRNGRRLSQKSVDVASGTRNLTLPVPTGVKPGWYALSVEVVVPGAKTLSFRKWLRL